MTDDEILWEPPPKRHHRSEWTAKLLACKKRPGEFGRLHTATSGKAASVVAQAVRNAAEALVGVGGERGWWEVTVRTLPTGGAGVWVTYHAPEPIDLESDLLPEALVDRIKANAEDPSRLVHHQPLAGDDGLPQTILGTAAGLPDELGPLSPG